MLAAVGFCDELRAEPGNSASSGRNSGEAATIGGGGAATTVNKEDARERKKWLVLEGTVGPDGKPIAAVGEAQLRILRFAREEVRHEDFAEGDIYRERQIAPVLDYISTDGLICCTIRPR